MIEMAESKEWRLVEQYAADRSDAAFRAIVDRYAGLVYSTCLREVGDRQVAEDATQATFLVLAAKAPRLRAGSGPLSAWLFSTARLVSKNARRREAVERRREQAAMDDFQHRYQTVTAGNEAAISENLHLAMDRLSAADRQTILLRYFEQRSMRETGDILGVSEDAAKKRVGRALEKLRDGLTRLTGRGGAVAIAVVAAFLTDRAVEAAPQSCIDALHAIQFGAALSSTLNVPTGGATHLSGNAQMYAKGALNTMRIATQLKYAAAIAGATIVMSVGAAIYGHSMHARVFAAVPTPTGGWVLRGRYHAGDVYNYALQQTATGNTTLPSGQVVPLKVDTDMSLKMNVQSVDAQSGDATVGIQIAISGVKSDGKPVPVPQQLIDQVTKPVVVTMSPLGRTAQTSADNNSVLGDFESSGCLPEQPVKPGDIWTASISELGCIYRTQSTLVRVEDENGRHVAVIDAVITRTGFLPGAAAEQRRQQGFDSANGEACLDIDTGVLLRRDIHAVSNIDTQTPNGVAHTAATTDQTMTLSGQ